MKLMPKTSPTMLCWWRSSLTGSALGWAGDGMAACVGWARFSSVEFGGRGGGLGWRGRTDWLRLSGWRNWVEGDGGSVSAEWEQGASAARWLGRGRR